MMEYGHYCAEDFIDSRTWCSDKMTGTPNVFMTWILQVAKSCMHTFLATDTFWRRSWVFCSSFSVIGTYKNAIFSWYTFGLNRYWPQTYPDLLYPSASSALWLFLLALTADLLHFLHHNYFTYATRDGWILWIRYLDTLQSKYCPIWIFPGWDFSHKQSTDHWSMPVVNYQWLWARWWLKVGV